MESDSRRKIIFTDEADRWYKALSLEDTNRFAERMDFLREIGPNLGMPAVGLIKSSRHHNMKELRSKTGHLRILFAFDRNGHAVFLIGGDKTNKWTAWYRKNIPRADRLYDQHLRSIGKEKSWQRAGSRSGGRAR